MQLPLSPSSIDAAPARSANITWARSRFSAFFHGTSVHTSRPFTSSPSAGPKSARSSDQLPARSPLHLPEIGGGSATHSRSRTSTRSMIDPTSSPAISTRLFTADTYMRLIMAPTVPEQSHPASPASFAGVDPEEQHLVQQINDRRQRPRRKRRRAIVVSRRAVPKMKRNAVRGRVRGCILWGILLTIVLTICAAFSLPLWGISIS